MSSAHLEEIKTKCPICQDEIRPDLLNEIGLTGNDLTLIEGLAKQKSLMKTLELGELTSKYFKHGAIGTEIQVKESQSKLSEKASELIVKSKQLAQELVRASEQGIERLDKENQEKQIQRIEKFRQEIEKLQADYNKLEEDHLLENGTLNLVLQDMGKNMAEEVIESSDRLGEVNQVNTSSPNVESYTDTQVHRVTVWNPTRGRVVCFACRQKGSTSCH